MTRQPVDAGKLVKDWLAGQAATAFPGLLVALELPSKWKLGDGPVLVVSDDGGPVAWPVATKPTIRVTSWTSGRDRTYAHWALGLMLGTPIPGVAAVLPGTGIIEARDDKNRGDLTSFTVRLRVRTRVRTV